MKDKIQLLTYFPFIGWYIVLWLKNDDELITSHIKQAFFLASISAGSLILLILTTIFVPESVKAIRFGIVVVIYLIYIIYFALCIFGTFKIEKEEKADFPLIGNLIKKYTDKIIL